MSPQLNQLYPSAVRSSPAYTDWTNTTVSAVSANLGSPMTAPAAVRDSAFEFFDPSWATDTIVNSIGGYVTARYTGPDTLYFGGSPTAFVIELWLDEATDVLLSSATITQPAVQKNTWNHFLIPTATVHPITGAKLTKANFTSLYAVIRSAAYPAGYQLEVAAIALSVDYDQPPTFAAVAPQGTVQTASPTFTLTYTDPDGSTATAYRARVVKWKDIAAYDNSWNIFNDAGTPMAWDSGVVTASIPSTTNISVTPPVSLDNFTEYRCYIQVLSAGVWSQPLKTNSYAYAVTKFIQPSAPHMQNVIPYDDDNVILLTLSQRENDASIDQSDQKSGLQDWAAKSNCTLTRYTTGGGVAKFDGVVGPALDILSAAAGDYEFGTNDTSAPPWGVTSYDQWSATIKMTPVGFAGSAGTETSRRARIDIKWFNSSNTLVSTTLGRELMTVVGEWVTVHTTGKKPAGATKASVRIRVLGTTAASERHFATSFSFKPGPVNLARDPLNRIDTNGDGVPDAVTSYRLPGTGTAPVYSIDAAPPVDALLAGDSCLKIAIPAGNADGEVGFEEKYRLARGCIYTAHAWVYSDFGTSTDLYANNGSPYNHRPRLLIPANTLTKVSFSFVQFDTQSETHVYYRFAPQAGGNIWVSAIMLEPADAGIDARISTPFGSFESGLGTFINVANTQLNQQTPQSVQGTYSLRVKAIAAGDMTFAATQTGNNGYVVTPGGKAMCQFNIARDTVDREIEMRAYWYQAGGAASTIRASELLQTKNESTGGGNYTMLEKVFDVPSDALYCQIRITVKSAAINEYHYVDLFQFFSGDPVSGIFIPEHYTPGSFFNARYMEIQKSSGDGIWSEITSIPDHTSGTWSHQFYNVGVYDYFQEPGQEVWYRARVRALDHTGSYAYSVWSQPFKSDGLALLTSVWLKSLSDPTLNMEINYADRRTDFTVQKQRVTHMPLGSEKPLVISGRRRSTQHSFNIYCDTYETYEKVIALLDADQAMLLQMPKRSLWVNLAGDYNESQYKKNSYHDTEDTVISGVFQEVRAPI